jgi:phenylacetate-CoA ligase
MTTITTRETQDDMLRVVPEVVRRIAWSPERLKRERQTPLRELLSAAKSRSAWHRRRLAHVDPETFTEEQLVTLPVMTKADLREHFDESFTDARLSRRLVEEYIATDHHAGDLLGQYRVVVTSGSSGQRGAFVYTREDLLLSGLMCTRFGLRREFEMPGVLDGRRVFITLPGTRGAIALFGDLPGNLALPATLPIERIVEALNESQPSVVVAVSSIWPPLVAEARAGRLRIAPRRLVSNAEPLYPEMRRAVETTWSVALDNMYGTAEGACAESCGQAEGMHLNEDGCIFELLDDDGTPIQAGSRAARLYVTNVYNRTQPLIRYELEDEMVLLGDRCACGSGLRRIADVTGRLWDAFRYPGGIVIHPYAFRAPLDRAENVLMYQVRQTPTGASILVCTDGGAVDVPRLRGWILAQLRQGGLRAPQIDVTMVDRIERLENGKLRRYVALPG